jgi:ABC-2 type transport system ATP-binding protein
MPAIEIEGVTKFYGKQKALDNISLKVDGEEVLGLLGPNGAGKSTLMKILAGLMLPSSGRVLIHGNEVLNNLRSLKSRIGYLPENNPLYHDLYVREYLLDVLKMYDKEADFKKQLDRVIERTGLVPEQHKKIGSLSKGYRQRVGIAQALIHDPEILILDEPTTGLDPNQLVEIRHLISSLGEEKTVILSTHIMQEVEAVCNRVIILNQGRLVADKYRGGRKDKVNWGKQFRLLIKETVSKQLFDELPLLAAIEQKSDGEWLLLAEPGCDIREPVFRFAVDKGLNILSFSEVENQLEKVFHHLTADSVD